ncbi:nicotinamide mononucleotide transporter, partial [Francisella tularensis]|uniref:nicotinamide mononucleotide transporter n=1 Tax=Francisella tularensis TaxID=263 RepID=UPI002381BAF7
MVLIYQSIVSSFYDYQSYFELVAAASGVAGVYFSYKRNILVYLVIFISSAIYVCLLYDWK